MSILSGFFHSRDERPTDDERLVAARILTLIREHVYVGPKEGELSLTGVQEQDVVLMFRWTHAKACEIINGVVLKEFELSPHLRAMIESLHKCAKRVTELLAPPVCTIAELEPDAHRELAQALKGFLDGIADLGEGAQGKKWP